MSQTNTEPQKKSSIKLTIKVIILAILIVTYLILAYAVYVNITDLPNGFFNPPLPLAEQFISLDYPPAQGFTVKGDLLHLNVNLTTSGSFVQGQPVNISVSGSISDTLLENLTDIDTSLSDKETLLSNGTYVPYSNSEIDVGFGGAANVLDDELSYPIGGPSIGFVTLLLNYTNPNCIQTLGLGDTDVGAPTQQIEWTSQGDYSPTISFSTGSYGYPNYTDIQETYSNFSTVHIVSPDVLAQARYNRVTEVLTIVLTIFGFVEGAKIIIESLIEKKQSPIIVNVIDSKQNKTQKEKPATKPIHKKEKLWGRIKRKHRH